MVNKKKRYRKNKKRRYVRKSIFIAITLAIIFYAGTWLFNEINHAKPAEVWFETKASDTEISLPKDDAPHHAKMEWWYYNGHLTTKSGKQFSFHYTTFLLKGLNNHMVSHVSLSDFQTGQHYIDQRRTAGNPSNKTENQFEFVHGGWLMSGGNGKDKLEVANKEFSFSLKLASSAPPVFHGQDGIISLGTAGSSYYYSRTRMNATGTVKVNNKIESVEGLIWFDHQWGDFATLQLSWDWFSLQLENNTDLMIYQLHDKLNKPVLYSASITKNGQTEILNKNEFSASQEKKWTSKKTGITYPVEWNIKIPKYAIDIQTRSVLENSEFDAKLTTYNTYWEGAIIVQGSHTGRGFMELKGYKPESLKSRNFLMSTHNIP